MNYQTKRTIDNAVPAVLAGVAGFIAFKKGANWKIVVAAIVIVFIVAYIVTTQVTKNLYVNKPKDVPLVKDYSTDDCKDYDGTSLAKLIKDDYDPGFLGSIFHTGSAATYNQVLSLSNCQLIRLYNYWNQNYYAETGKTLKGVFMYMNENGFLRGVANGDLLNAIVNRLASINGIQ